MQTECSPTLFEFEPVERHKVVAGSWLKNDCTGCCALSWAGVSPLFANVKKIAAETSDLAQPVRALPGFAAEIKIIESDMKNAA